MEELLLNMLQQNFDVWRIVATHAELCAEVSVLDLRYTFVAGASGPLLRHQHQQ